MQKLKDEPRIEFENMARCYGGVREDDWNQEYFEAWCAGQTGHPMVDACMRALHQRSWINFRMRAMLSLFRHTIFGFTGGSLAWRRDDLG